MHYVTYLIALAASRVTVVCLTLEQRGIIGNIYQLFIVIYLLNGTFGSVNYEIVMTIVNEACP